MCHCSIKCYLHGHSDQCQSPVNNPDVEVLVLAAPPEVEVGEAIEAVELVAGDGSDPASVLVHEQLVLESVHSCG